MTKPLWQGIIPRISVVIPSRQRPLLLARAIGSVLNQKRDDLEIIVVLDGDTSGSAERLQQMASDGAPIRILGNASRMGAPIARNQGVQAARGEWIAFLDDDDEWLPGKLDKQMALALRSQYREPVVSCQSIARTSHISKIHPKLPPSQPLGEYFFTCRGLRGESGLLQSSTLLTRRSLLLRVPFSPGLKRHQDLDWALRANLQPTVGIEFVAEPLSCWNQDEDGRERVTDFLDWRYCLQWAKSLGAILTPRAYASYLLGFGIYAAGRRCDWRGGIALYREAIRNGSPSIREMAMALWIWLAAAFRVKKFLRKIFLQMKPTKIAPFAEKWEQRPPSILDESGRNEPMYEKILESTE